MGVGVSNPDKVGRDVGDICGLPEPVGITATDDVDALIALKPDALVHYGPTAMHAKDNISLITRFLRAGIDVCSTAMTPWVWPTMHLNPPNWIEPITAGLRAGGVVVLHHRHRPGLRQRPVPDDADGPVLRGAARCAPPSCWTTPTTRATTNVEMGIGREPEYSPMLENRDVLIFAWGATVPMIAHAAGHHARRDHHHLGQVGDAHRPQHPRRASSRPATSPPSGSPSTGVYQGETRIQLEHVNRIGLDAAPDWPTGHDNDVYRVDIEGTPSIFQETAFRFTDGSGRDAAAAGCLATGMRALECCPGGQRLAAGLGHRARPSADPGAGPSADGAGVYSRADAR